MKSFRFPPDSPYREQRLAFQQSNPDVRTEPVAPVETPRDKIAGKLKGIADAVGRDPDVRSGVERKMFELKAKQAVKTAFKNACNNRTFARENGDRKYDIVVGSGSKATLMYNVNGRTFVTGDFEVGEAGARLPQAELTAKIEKTIVDDIAFAEVIAPQIKTDND